MVVGVALKEAKGIMGKIGVFLKILIGFVILVAVVGGIYFGLKAAGVIEVEEGIPGLGRMRDMLIREKPPEVPAEVPPEKVDLEAQAKAIAKEMEGKSANDIKAAMIKAGVPEKVYKEYLPEEKKPADTRELKKIKEEEVDEKEKAIAISDIFSLRNILIVVFVFLLIFALRQVRKERKIKKSPYHPTNIGRLKELIKEIAQFHHKKENVSSMLLKYISRFPCYDPKLSDTIRYAPETLREERFKTPISFFVTGVGRLFKISKELENKLKEVESVLETLRLDNENLPRVSGLVNWATKVNTIIERRKVELNNISECIERYKKFEAGYQERVDYILEGFSETLMRIKNNQSEPLKPLDERLGQSVTLMRGVTTYKDIFDWFKKDVLGHPEHAGSLFAEESERHKEFMDALRPLLAEIEKELIELGKQLYLNRISLKADEYYFKPNELKVILQALEFVTLQDLSDGRKQNFFGKKSYVLYEFSREYKGKKYQVKAFLGRSDDNVDHIAKNTVVFNQIKLEITPEGLTHPYIITLDTKLAVNLAVDPSHYQHLLNELVDKVIEEKIFGQIKVLKIESKEYIIDSERKQFEKVITMPNLWKFLRNIQNENLPIETYAAHLINYWVRFTVSSRMKTFALYKISEAKEDKLLFDEIDFVINDKGTTIEVKEIPGRFPEDKDIKEMVQTAEVKERRPFAEMVRANVRLLKLVEGEKGRRALNLRTKHDKVVHLTVRKIVDVPDKPDYVKLRLGRTVSVGVIEPLYLPKSLMTYHSYDKAGGIWVTKDYKRIDKWWVKTFYYRPALDAIYVDRIENHAADLVVVYNDPDKGLSFAMIERGTSPYEGMYALPGGMVDEGEDKDPRVTAKREFIEEAGHGGGSHVVRRLKHALKIEDFVKIGEYKDKFQRYDQGEPKDRDPRDPNTISHAYIVEVDKDYELKAADDAKAARWVEVGKIGDDYEKEITEFLESVEHLLAFDHYRIIKDGLTLWALNIKLVPLLEKEVKEYFSRTLARVEAMNEESFNKVLGVLKSLKVASLPRMSSLIDKKLIIEPRPDICHFVFTIDGVDLSSKKIVLAEDVTFYYKEGTTYRIVGGKYKLSEDQKTVGDLTDLTSIKKQCDEWVKEKIEELKAEAKEKLGSARPKEYIYGALGIREITQFPLEYLKGIRPFFSYLEKQPLLAGDSSVTKELQDKWISLEITGSSGLSVCFRISNVEYSTGYNITFDRMLVLEIVHGEPRPISLFEVTLSPPSTIQSRELKDKLSELFKNNYEFSKERSEAVKTIKELFKKALVNFGVFDRGYSLTNIRGVFKKILDNKKISLNDFRDWLITQEDHDKLAFLISVVAGKLRVKYTIKDVDKDNNIYLSDPIILNSATNEKIEGVQKYSIEQLCGMNNKKVIENILDLATDRTAVRNKIVDKLKATIDLSYDDTKEIEGIPRGVYHAGKGTARRRAHTNLDSLIALLKDTPIIRIEDFKDNLVGSLMQLHERVLGKNVMLLVSEVKTRPHGSAIKFSKVFIFDRSGRITEKDVGVEFLFEDALAAYLMQYVAEGFIAA